MPFRDAHSLGQSGRTGNEQSIVTDAGSILPDEIDPQLGASRPEEDRLALAVARANDVRAPVHPISEIDIQTARRPVHDLGPWSYPSVTVRAGIDTSPIGLRFDQTDRDPAAWMVADEQTPDQFTRDRQCIAGIERSIQSVQSSNHASSAFCVCNRFSAWSQTIERGPSRTSAVISSPRCAGRQCITTTSSSACRTTSPFSW